MTRVLIGGLALAIVTLAAPAFACMWDYDTIRDEQRGLPSVSAILAGKWERHSPFFYQNRVDRMSELVKREPQNLAAWDNLAVAYEKLGQVDKAIETILHKESLATGQYTTYANLGTFYIHKGDYDRGAHYLEMALKINPAAHFGREEYQLMLVNFLRDAKADPRKRLNSNFLIYHQLTHPTTRPATTASKESGRHSGTQPATQADDSPDFYWPGHPELMDMLVFRGSPAFFETLGLKENVFDGIVGMIRFGTGKSPDLYMALGDLLVARGDKNLAYRAYLRAQEFGHPDNKHLDDVFSLLKETVYYKEGIDEIEIAKERQQGEAWVAKYQDFEDNLIRSGKDPEIEANLAPFYADAGKSDEPVKVRQPWRIKDQMTFGIVAAAIGASMLIGLWRRWRRRPLRH